MVTNVSLFALIALFSSTSLAYRLPWTVIPQLYHLEILTNLGDEHGKFEFHGKVCIEAKAVEETKNITLNAKNLEIDNKNVRVNDVHDIVERITQDDENELLSIHLKEPLEKDRPVNLCIPFKGKLEDVLSGFYRSVYEDKGTKMKHYLATTQFEPTDARRAFPCFDEPEMKAKFNITIGHSDKYIAISNMPALKRDKIENKDGWTWTRFQETVPMSTYLIAFVVSDFRHETAPKTFSNVTFRIWSRKDALDQVAFAAEVGPKCLSYYEDFFDVKYPLPKQDMVAIPDFAAGAMENWGLITYRETYLLYDPKESSTVNKEGVASVVAHELAHQWFGNLVTMKWWDDLWLNEGFATYMASLAVEHVFPEWKSLEEDSIDSLVTVFSFDSLKSSHPISVPVGHPREINQIFDTISYKKGSFILRMMSLFLGEDVFRKGVSNYLKLHKFGNAEQDDLWHSLTKEAHLGGDFPKDLTVKMVMDTWTLQTGYPVIKVVRNYESAEAGKFELSQKRFLSDTLEAKKDNKEAWWVPITWTTQTEKDFNSTKIKFWMPASDEVQTLSSKAAAKEWLLLNIDGLGLYKINYDNENWNMLVDFMSGPQYNEIPIINRIQLIDDSSFLARTNHIKYDIFFNLLNYVKKEVEYTPWRVALGHMSSIHKQMKRSSNFGLFKSFMKEFLTPIYKKVGSLANIDKDDSTLSGIKQKSLIASYACRFNVLDCVSDANTRFREFQDNPQKEEVIPKDLRTVIYCSALRHGGESEWNFLWQQYLISNVATVKNSILNQLGCTREIWLLRRYLEWSLKSDSGIRRQDFTTVFSAVANNEVGFYVAKNFLEENIAEIYKLLSPNQRRLGRCLTPLASQMTKETDFEWFQNFTRNNAKYFKASQQSVDISTEMIKLNLQWQEKHAEEVKQLLEKQ